MYIWDVELSSFSFGWQKTIDRFVSEHTSEKYADYDETGEVILSDVKSEYSFTCNPITYKKLLEERYRDFTLEARKLIKTPAIDLHRLFTLDFLLWGIVWDYTRADSDEVINKENNSYLKTFETETFLNEMAMFLAYEDYEDYFWGGNMLRIKGVEQEVQKIMFFDLHSTLKTTGIRLEHQKAGRFYD